MNTEVFIGEMAGMISSRYLMFAAVAITAYLLLFGNPFFSSRKSKPPSPAAKTRYLTSLHSSVKTFDYSPPQQEGEGESQQENTEELPA